MPTGRWGLRTHIRMLVPLFGLIAAVWLLRLIVAAAGSPSWLVRMISVSVASSVALLLAVLLIHFKGYGSYPSVVMSAFLLSAWSELLIIAAIAVAVQTGTSNIYTAPEYSMTVEDPRHLKHIYGHLTYGIGLGTFSGAAMGSLLLWLLRLLIPRDAHQVGEKP
jgi:hypothetical protein